MKKILSKGEVFPGSGNLAEIFKNAGCEALEFDEKTLSVDERSYDQIPAAAEFKIGFLYLIMAVPPIGLTRNEALDHWGKDTSLYPIAFLTLKNKDSRIKLTSSQVSLSLGTPNGDLMYLPVGTMLFGEVGVRVGLDKLMFGILYSDLLEVMKSIRVANEAQNREMRYADLIGATITSKK